jgi:hypothetical protein
MKSVPGLTHGEDDISELTLRVKEGSVRLTCIVKTDDSNRLKTSECSLLEAQDSRSIRTGSFRIDQ